MREGRWKRSIYCKRRRGREEGRFLSWMAELGWCLRSESVCRKVVSALERERGRKRCENGALTGIFCLIGKIRFSGLGAVNCINFGCDDVVVGAVKMLVRMWCYTTLLVVCKWRNG